MDHMEFSIALPPYVEFTNAGIEWANMKQRLSVHGSHSSDPRHRHEGLVEAFLMNIASQQVQDIFNMFGLSYEEGFKFRQILQRLEDVCVPRFLIIYNRYKFFTCRQMYNDRFDYFLRDLLNWSEKCEFGDLKDILLKDCIITGIPDISVRQKLLETEELDFAKTIEICRAVEKRQKVRNVYVFTDQVTSVDASVNTDQVTSVDDSVNTDQVTSIDDSVNTDQATFVDDSVIKKNREKCKIGNEQHQESVKEFSDVSIDVTLSKLSSGIKTTNIVKDVKSRSSAGVNSDDKILSVLPRISDNLHKCSTVETHRPIPDYEIEEAVKMQSTSLNILRRSERHKKVIETHLKSVPEINKMADHKNEEKGNCSKHLRLLKGGHELNDIIDSRKDQMEMSCSTKLELSKTDSKKHKITDPLQFNYGKNVIPSSHPVPNKTDDHKIEDKSSDEKPNSMATSTMSKMIGRKEFDESKTLKLSMKTLANKHRLGEYTDKSSISKQELACSFCNKNFPDRISIVSHVKMVHGKKNFRKLSLKCRVCKATFVDLATLKKHRLLHKNEKKFQCNVCPTNFSNQSHLKVHMRLHTGERPYTCDTCGASYPEASKLKAHMRKHTGEKPYHCSICGRTFAWTAAYTRHLRTHTGEKPYTCEFCGINFADFTSLQRHIRTHTLEKPYKCDKCNTKFTDPSALKLHNRIHNGERPYVCGTCGTSFIRSQHLKEHMKLHTGEKPFRCETCGAKFAEASKLKSHGRKHTGEKPYLCKICGTRFAWTAAFTRHMRTHTMEKPYVCNFCGTHYADHSTLIRHRRTHTGERPYPCKICGVNFADNSSLHRHVKIHTGEKSYTCEVCGSSFAVKSYLIRHMRTHTGEKPYSCDVCESKFTDSSKLNRHKKIHFKTETKQGKQKKSEVRQPQQYEQLQPVQCLPPGGDTHQPQASEKLDSWTDDQQQLISVVHNIQHPVVITTTLLPLNNALPYNSSFIHLS